MNNNDNAEEPGTSDSTFVSRATQLRFVQETKLKILVYIGNTIILLMGVGLILFGIFGCRLPGPQLSSCQFAIPIGILTCLVTAMWYLAYRFNQLPLHLFYLILLMCVIGSQLVFGFRALKLSNEAVIRSHLKNVYRMRKQAQEVDMQVKELQTMFGCCGFQGPNGDDLQETHNVSVLIAECCADRIIACTILDAHQDGCAGKIIKEHREWERTFGIFLLISAVLTITFAFVDVAQLGPVYN